MNRLVILRRKIILNNIDQLEYITNADTLLLLDANKGIYTQGDGISLVSSNSQFLKCDSDSSLQMGDSDFAVGGWFKITSDNDVSQGLIGKYNTNADEREYELHYHGSVNKFRWVVSNNGSDVTDVVSDTMELDQWYFVYAYYNNSTNKIGISLDGATAVEADFDNGTYVDDTIFVIGGWSNIDGTTANTLADAECQNLFILRDPTDTHANIIEALYNEGLGIDYTNLTSSQKTSFGIIHWWRLDDPLDYRLDSVGTAHLTQSGSPTTATGTAIRKAFHGESIKLWIDQSNSIQFISSGSTKPSYHSGEGGLWGAADALEGSSTVIGSKKNYSIFVGASLDKPSETTNLYSEDDGTDYTDFRIRSDGKLELVVSGTSAISPNYAFDTHTISAGTATTLTALDGHEESKCVITIGSHEYILGDQITVSDAGEPFNGTHTITEVSDTTITYIVDDPSPATGTISNGTVVRTGGFECHQYFNLMYGAGSKIEYRKVVYGAVRNTNKVRFYRGNTYLGESTLSGNPEGSSSGTPKIFTSSRGTAPNGLIENIYIADGSLDSDAVKTVSQIMSIRMSRTVGTGPLGVHFDSIYFVGIDRLNLQDYIFEWDMGDSNAGLLRNGRSRNNPTGFVVAYTYPQNNTSEPINYNVSLTVATAPYDRDGQAQSQSILFYGTVATVTINPSSHYRKTIYVSSVAGDASNNGSVNSPMSRFDTALNAAAPGTQILIGSSGTTTMNDRGKPPCPGISVFGYDDGGGPGPSRIKPNGAAGSSFFNQDNPCKDFIISNVKLVPYIANSGFGFVPSDTSTPHTNYLIDNVTVDAGIDGGARSFWFGYTDHSVFINDCRFLTYSDDYGFVELSPYFSFMNSSFDASGGSQHLTRLNMYHKAFFQGGFRTGIGKGTTYGAFLTSRHNSRYLNVQDNITSTTIDHSAGPDIIDDNSYTSLGCMYTRYERNNITYPMTLEGHSCTTVVDSTILSGTIKNLENEYSNRISPTNVKVYKNDVYYRTDNFVIDVPLTLSKYNTVLVGNDTGDTLESPTITGISNQEDLLMVISQNRGGGGVLPRTLTWEYTLDGTSYSNVSGVVGHDLYSINSSGFDGYRMKITDGSGNIVYSDKVSIDSINHPVNRKEIGIELGN